ncbi:MAG: hypothetical protein JWM98_3088, partial [Thermoleophilia bacterium]|nr:hypothetical protein [Thermoleophilia bacterium]
MADIANITRSISGLEVALTRTALTDFATFAKGATSEMVGDMFCLSHADSAKLFADMGKRGVAQRYLADPERVERIATTLEGSGAKLTSYGSMPLKNHSKAYVRDGSHAFFTTGAFTGLTPKRYEFVSTFQGEAAKAVQAVTDAQIGGDTRAMRDAAKHAASFGILYNDARSGSTFLTDTLFDMVRTAEHRVVVSTKIMDDTRMKKLVADAAARGVDVAFTDIRSMGMHGNLVVADDSVYFGTAHMSSRSLGDMRYAYRQSRELGIVQHDAKLAHGMLARLDEIGMPRFTAEEFSKSVKLDA